MPRNLVLAILVLAAAVSAGCAQVLGDPFHDKRPLEVSDGGKARGDGSVGSRISAPDAGRSEPPLYLAMTHLDLGETGPEPVGFDLDQVATCRSHTDAGLPWSSSSVNNQVGALARDFLERTNQPTSEKLNGVLPLGVATTIIRLIDYNREADDDEVFVETLRGQFDTNANDGRTAPAWDGTDVYAVEDTSLVPSPMMRYSALARATGSVAGYTLSVPLANALTLATVKARLSVVNDTWTLEGVAGQLMEVRAYADLLRAVYGCNVDVLAEPAVQHKVCAARDVNLAGEGGACDGLSAGYTFEAHQVKLGGTYTPAAGCSFPPFDCPE